MTLALLAPAAAAAQGHGDRPSPARAALATAGRTALLGAAGDATLAAALDARLVAAISARDRELKLVGAAALARALMARPPVASALVEAEGALARADRAALYMKRGAAVGAAREAIATLRRSQAQFARPAALARAQLSLAAALLLEPADQRGASDAVREALRVAPGFQPNKDRANPTVRTLIAEARTRRDTPAAPATGALSRLAARLSLAHVVWVSVMRPAAGGGAGSAGGGRALIQVLVFDAASRAARTSARKWAKAQPDKLASEAAALVLQALGAKAATGGAGPRPGGPGAGGATSAARRPWYKRWWVWAIAGAVAVGAGVGIGVGLGRGSSSGPASGFDIAFRR